MTIAGAAKMVAATTVFLLTFYVVFQELEWMQVKDVNLQDQNYIQLCFLENLPDQKITPRNIFFNKARFSYNIGKIKLTPSVYDFWHTYSVT